MELVDSTKEQNLMKGMCISSAENATITERENKPSTKKKSKRGTVKERGINSSLNRVKSVNGVKSRSK